MDILPSKLKHNCFLFLIQDEDRFNLAASFNNQAFSEHIQRFIQGHSER